MQGSHRGRRKGSIRGNGQDFSTTGNFFRGDGKTPWDKIVTEQTERDPWVDLKGVEHSFTWGPS
eukprot:scaffold123481_cov23-Cyclotella_meneghiniana.AAC.1